KQYITDKGKAWGGITLADDKMMELTRMIIQKTKWKGGMELELIKTSAVTDMINTSTIKITVPLEWLSCALFTEQL
ncbi:MAG: hypothetical protein MUF15_19815, partial [Acidobacteria bacterium]|nr:hypothetical protein [Acidobacteriota bacterium]